MNLALCEIRSVLFGLNGRVEERNLTLLGDHLMPVNEEEGLLRVPKVALHNPSRPHFVINAHFSIKWASDISVDSPSELLSVKGVARLRCCQRFIITDSRVSESCHSGIMHVIQVAGIFVDKTI